MSFGMLKKGMVLTIILLGIGIIGAIFFFPINFDDQYTCLYHRIFAPEHHPSQIGQSAVESGSHQHVGSQNSHSHLVGEYILPFGLIWWMSLMVVALAFWGLRRGRIHKRVVKDES